ncbi:unnamed protein product [Cercospora beticola]|nr:unnamed protein product [Cercospora beticola]
METTCTCTFTPLTASLHRHQTDQRLLKSSRNNQPTMSSLPHQTAGLKDETPSTSETAVSGNAGGNIVSNQSQSESEKPQIGASQSKPGSAEEAAEKLYLERMEDEYAKREGGA